MDLKLLAPILVVYATTRCSVGNPYPLNIHGNILLEKKDAVNKAEHKDSEYLDSIKDMIPKLERKSRDLGMDLNRYQTCWLYVKYIIIYYIMILYLSF